MSDVLNIPQGIQALLEEKPKARKQKNVKVRIHKPKKAKIVDRQGKEMVNRGEFLRKIKASSAIETQASLKQETQLQNLTDNSQKVK